MQNEATVALVMGSNSDFPALTGCIKTLRDFGIKVIVRVISAHRTPDAAAEFAKNARENGIDIIIGAAGKAAHLPGVLAAFTTLPVIGVPMKSDALDGMDALLSMVQMPPGIPVATVAIGGGKNAAVLAASILSLSYPEIEEKLVKFKKDMAVAVAEKDAEIQKEADAL